MTFTQGTNDLVSFGHTSLKVDVWVCQMTPPSFYLGAPAKEFYLNSMLTIQIVQ